MNYECVIASKEQIIKKWDYEIKRHENSPEWIYFKNNSLANLDTRIVYMGILDGNIITEATAIISLSDKGMQNKEGLIGEDMAYLSAFRTNKEYESLGYFSKLYKFMENDLRKRGFKTLTLGVEPCEVRNILIYFSWGYINYIKSNYENYLDSKVLVNYYSKNLE